MSNSQTPEYKIVDSPKGWGNGKVLFRNDSELLNDRIAPDEESMIFIKDRLQERERLQSENTRLQEQLELSNKRYEEVNQPIVEKNQRLQEENAAVREELTAPRANYESVKLIAHERLEELGQVKTENETLLQSISALQSQLSELRQKWHETTQENLKLKAQLEELKKNEN